MKNEQTHLRFAHGFITIVMVTYGIALVLSTILMALNIMKIELFQNGILTIGTQNNGSLLSNSLSFAGGYIILFILYCVRQFFKNILDNQIFVAQNVKLAKQVALLLFIASFLGDGIFKFNGFSFLNITFLITSLVVWTLAKVLEKAKAIAEENEFTI